jgi:4-hydroxybenzoate polyprenyltransferase
MAFGLEGAFWVARAMHAGVLVLLAVMLHLFGLGWIARAGMIVVAGLLAYEHALVGPKDLSRMNAAFFTLNGIISVVFFVAVGADVLWGPRP